MFYGLNMTCTPTNLDFFLQLFPTSATGSLQTLNLNQTASVPVLAKKKTNQTKAIPSFSNIAVQQTYLRL